MRRTCTHHCLFILGLSASAGCFAPEGMPASDDTSGAGEEDSSDTSEPTTTPPTTSATASTTDDGEDGSDSDPTDPTDPTGPTDPTDPTGPTDPTDAGDTTDAGEDDSSTGDDATTGAPPAPTVVDTLPADGATGVRADQAIVVAFDTAMDQAATQAAYQSASIPAVLVTFSWNDAGDEMTVTPLGPLPYAEGDDPTTLAPFELGFTITTTATSLEGVALEDDISVSFSTLRRFDQVIERDAAMSGNVGDVAGAIGSNFVGDRNTNEPVRYAVTFGLDALAPEVLEIESTTFRASWSSQSGNPWGGLGGGTVFQHVVYDDLDDAFDAPVTGLAEGLFGTVVDTDVSRDAAWALETALADLGAHDDRLQRRLRWVLGTDNDGGYDSVTLDPANLELHVTYLAP
jgi:hypothetical protein